MLTGYDSVTVANLPPNGNFYLGYINGHYTNYLAVSQAHPNVPILSVTTVDRTKADICDCEKGDFTPSQAAAGLLDGLWPVIYSDVSDYPTILAAVGKPFPWYAANPTGKPHIYPGSWLTQWGFFGTYDASWAIDLSPFQPSAPIPDHRQERQMLARNTHGKGYWAVRPTGATYAMGGAPSLGPLQKYLTEWGIGTIDNPIVGIADDGVGGFTLEADRNDYPGVPALYNITADGRFAK